MINDSKRIRITAVHESDEYYFCAKIVGRIGIATDIECSPIYGYYMCEFDCEEKYDINNSDFPIYDPGYFFAVQFVVLE